MTRRRIGLGALGIALLVLARLLPVGEYVPVEPLVGALGNDLYVVGIVSLVGLIVTASILVRWRSKHVDETELPDVEGRAFAPEPGTEFDDELSAPLTVLPVVGSRRRDRIHARLRSTAVRSVRSSEGCDETEARALLESGEWTDDERVAAFLRSEPEYALVDRLRLNLRGRSWFRRSVRDTVRSLAATRRDQFASGGGATDSEPRPDGGPRHGGESDAA